MNLKMRLSDIKGDLSGAVSAAIISIPLSIGYGILFYGSLGYEIFHTYCILDMKLVNEIDSTSAEILAQISKEKAEFNLSRTKSKSWKRDKF